MKIFPKCVHEGRRVAFSATGYFVPCCWCDDLNLFVDFKQITQDKFHISNIKSPSDVFYSEEWKDLLHTIENDGKNAPAVCQEKCGREWIHKDIIAKS